METTLSQHFLSAVASIADSLESLGTLHGIWGLFYYLFRHNP